MKRTTYDPSTARAYYLNNRGDRAVRIDANGNRERIAVKWAANASPVSVAVKYWESCGNWSFANVRQPNTRRIIAVYPDSDIGPADAAFFMPYDLKHPQQ